MSDVETLLEQIARIGAVDGGGVRRLAWTAEDAQLGEWFARACAERGLDVRVDRCGNQWAWWGDPDAALAEPPAAAEADDEGRAEAGEQIHEQIHEQVHEQAAAEEHEQVSERVGDEEHDGAGDQAGDGEAGDRVEVPTDGDPTDAAEPPQAEGDSDVDDLFTPAVPAGRPPVVEPLVLGAGGVVTGSHLDSVPGGGAYDGPLGVVTALAAIDLLREQGFEPRRAIGLVRFVDEEGARFGVPCTGSRLLTGQVEPGDVLGLVDADGVTYADAAAKAGVDPDGIGRDDEVVARVAAFVELHVEQGFTLAADEVDAPLGVCGLIRPHGRWHVDMAGRGDHAGTARFVDRSDPMLELGRLVTTVRTAASRQDALGTVGKVEVHPNVPNAVPSAVRAWVDVRADTVGQVRSVVSELRAGGFDLVEESWTPATPFGAPLTERVARVAGEATGGGPLPVLATGAGHDAGVLATAGVAAAMIFVRNPTGVSHAPQEHVEPADAEAGVRSLAAVLADLCR